VRATFTNRQETLQRTLNISSLEFIRWHADLAGPLIASQQAWLSLCDSGNLIEAFSKYLVSVDPPPDEKPETVALAFLQPVLSDRFAAPGQVVSNNGTKFTQGAFKQLFVAL
jgi:hypothetical protein